MITIVNKYKVKDNIYCGRGTALGNPFTMLDESQRDDVCDEYQYWFDSKVDDNENNPQKDMLRKIYRLALIGDINLGCFCAPKRCHCDTIKVFIDSKIKEMAT